MANSGGIRAGKAFVEVYADNSKLITGLAKAGQQLKKFGQGISTLGSSMMAGGAAVAAPFLAATKHFMTFGSELHDMSARTGMGTNALSELGYAAGQSGASLGDVEIGVKKMQKAITAAKDGPLAGLKGMAPEKQFMAIAESLVGIQDPTARAAKALEIFGRSGTSLLPMIGDVKALRAEAVRLGQSIGPKQAAAADALGDAWDRVKASIGGVAMAIGSELADTLTKLAGDVLAHITAIRQWVSMNGELIVSIVSTAAKVVALGAAIFALGKVISTLGTITLGAKSLGLALMAMNPITIALTASVIALGAAYAYAASQQLKLNEDVDKEKAKNVAGAKVEASFAAGSTNTTEREIAILKADVDAAQGRVDDLKRLRDAERLTAKEAINPVKGLQAAGRAREIEKDSLPAAESELKRITLFHNKMKARLAAAVKSGELRSDWVRLLSKGEPAVATITTMAIKAGGTFRGSILEGMEKSWKASRGLYDDIARIRASAIEDPQARDEKLLNLEYDVKKREGAENGLDLPAIETARQEELKNIRAKYAKERQKSEEDIIDETEVARVNATMDGKDKEMALLRLKQAKERAEARKAGLDPALLAKKQRLEMDALSRGDVTASASATRGTFSSNIAGLGVGGGMGKKMVDGIAKSNKALDAMWEILRGVTVELAP